MLQEKGASSQTLQFHFLTNLAFPIKHILQLLNSYKTVSNQRHGDAIVWLWHETELFDTVKLFTNLIGCKCIYKF